MVTDIPHLRELYLEDLHKQVSYNGGKTTRSRVRKPSYYDRIPVWNNDTTKSGSHENVWVWSDTHFGHNNIIKYCNRPFECVDDMAQSLIDNHNEVVGDGDLVIWVGDVSFMPAGKTNEILAQLNGERVLVIGNHDIERGGKLKKMKFSSQHLLFGYEDHARDVQLLFTHFPMENIPKPWINVHGHIHNSYDTGSLQHINVSVEVIGYKPIHMMDLIEMAYTRNNSMEDFIEDILPEYNDKL